MMPGSKIGNSVTAPSSSGLPLPLPPQSEPPRASHTRDLDARVPLPKRLAAASVSGALINALDHPFDTFLTRRLVQSNSASSIDLLKRWARQKQLSRLFRGVGCNMFVQGSRSGLAFAGVDAASAKVGTSLGLSLDSVWLRPMTGAVLAPMELALSSPLQVAKVVCQSPQHPEITNGIQAVRQIWTSQGWRGFYRGSGIGYVSAITFPTIYWLMRAALPETHGTLSSTNFVTSWVAGATASLALNPLRLLKTRQQNGAAKRTRERTIEVMRGLWNELGFECFTRGSSIVVLRTGLVLALTHTLTEAVTGLLNPTTPVMKKDALRDPD